MDCYNDTAKVSWSAAKGADSYTVTAIATEGHQVSCETDGHQCDLTELQCGEMYNVSITNVGNICQTETNTNVTFSTRELSNISSQSSWVQVNETLIPYLFVLL